MKKIILIASMLIAVILTVTTFAASNDSNTQSGWTPVSLSDTQPFDVNCEYRAYYKLYNQYYYSIVVAQNKLLFITDSSSAPGVYYPNTLWIESSQKDILHLSNQHGQSTYKVKILDKRCHAPDTTPSGALMFFAKTQCPSGWHHWPFGKSTLQCNTTNCHIVLCKKD